MDTAPEPNEPAKAPLRDPRKPSEGEARSHAPCQPTVLIVDDVPNNLFALEAMLRRDDVEIVTAESGSAALEILLERDVAVAIVDVQMPEMDGFELASLMRGVSKTRCIPIIFVTAGSRDQARVFKGYEVGAVDYLFKPVDEHILRGKVDVFVTLEKHRQHLREAERMREMFIAVLGHDLRNPLGGILLATQLLQARSDGEAPDAACVERIRRSGERMRRMIEHLLDATRFRQDGRIALELEPADLRTLAEQVLSELDEGVERFQLDVAGDTSGTWDTDRMLQVLSNLIGNAVGHSPANSLVSIYVDGTSENDVSLQVDNGGAPIPEELHPILFEPFRRSSLHRRGESGLGLGLYITKLLVDAHRGAISFTSNEGTGTSFVVTLPRHTRAAEGGQPSAAVGCESAVLPPRTASTLLVDDEPSARLALGNRLEDQGYQ